MPPIKLYNSNKTTIEMLLHINLKIIDNNIKHMDLNSTFIQFKSTIKIHHLNYDHILPRIIY